MEPVRVRSANQDEAAVLLDLWRQADSPPSIGAELATVTNLLEKNPDGVLVAEVDGAVVGTLFALWDGWRGNMYRLAVLPEYRRRGIAGALVDEGQRRLRAHGCAKSSAIVLRDNDRATGFWRSTGYDNDPDTARYVRLD